MTPDRFEILWSRFVRVCAFVVGVGMMIYETVGDQSDRPWLYAAALGMMGLPIARAAENLLAKWSGSDKPGGDPPESRPRP